MKLSCDVTGDFSDENPVHGEYGLLSVSCRTAPQFSDAEHLDSRVSNPDILEHWPK